MLFLAVCPTCYSNEMCKTQRKGDKCSSCGSSLTYENIALEEGIVLIFQMLKKIQRSSLQPKIPS